VYSPYTCNLLKFCHTSIVTYKGSCIRPRVIFCCVPNVTEASTALMLMDTMVAMRIASIVLFTCLSWCTSAQVIRNVHLTLNGTKVPSVKCHSPYCFSPISKSLTLRWWRSLVWLSLHVSCFTWCSPYPKRLTSFPEGNRQVAQNCPGWYPQIWYGTLNPRTQKHFQALCNQHSVLLLVIHSISGPVFSFLSRYSEASFMIKSLVFNLLHCKLPKRLATMILLKIWELLAI